MKAHQPPAVVVGVCGHGLALVRALHGGGVKVVALDANPDLPGVRTRLAKVRMVSTINGPGLIDALLALRPTLGGADPPVLFLTNDTMVRTLGQHWGRLEGQYRMSWAHARAQLTPLLDKPALEARCRATGLAYPHTLVLNSATEVGAALEKVGLPMIVKPARPLSRFKTAQPDGAPALGELTQRFESDLPFLVQRYIPGDDTAIHFSALYLDHGRVLARFDGRKLRSRPLGHTTIAEPCPDDAVYAQTLRFFEGLGLSGPVSLELKRDPQGGLWVIEPTIGRTDFWVGLCIENGVNLPLVEYLHQTGRPVPALASAPATLWFNEDRDPLGRLWLARGGAGGMRGRRGAFVYLHRDDPGPARHFLHQAAAGRLAAVGRRVRRQIGLSGAEESALAALDSSSPACRAWRDVGALRTTLDWPGLMQGAGSVFDTPAWIENLAATCPVQGGKPLLLSVGGAEGDTVLPLRDRGGGRLESLSNFYAPLFNPLTTRHACAPAHAPAIARWLATQRVATLQLHPLDTGSPFWRALTQGLKAQGYWVDSYFSFGNWFHPCEGVRWAHYLAQRPSRLRNTIVRSRRRLAADPSVRISLLAADATLDQVTRAVQDFKAVYARSWKKPEPYPGFIDALCRIAHQAGWLRVGLCHRQGQPVAAQIWLVRGGVASIFKLAYDENHARLGAGTVLSAALTEHVLDVDQVHEIDFLAGDDPYKSEWMSQRRERRGIVAFLPHSLRGLAAAGLHFGGRALRRPQTGGHWEGRRQEVREPRLQPPAP